MADWKHTVFSGLIGGLIGSAVGVIAVRTTNKQTRFLLTQQIKDKFDSLAEKIEDSFSYLRHDVEVIDGYFDVKLRQKDESEAERRYNVIVDVGNFFEEVSDLYYRSKIEKGVDEGAIYQAIEQFTELCSEKKLMVTTFDNLRVGENWENVWTSIWNYLARKRAIWPSIKSFFFG